tara:strand:- start:64 stop:1056 length:993 start_codon:yes stop_codon:yes gene_type:complete
MGWLSFNLWERMRHIEDINICKPLTLSILPHQTTSYIPSSGRGTSDRFKTSFAENFEKAREDNLLSVGSARKLKRAINWMAYLSREKVVYVREINKRVKFRMSFITLTLPASQIHTDSQIKSKCLMPFLQWLRDKYNVKKYVWKAEAQKNGNIHFHISLDKFIHYQTLRNQWNRNVESLGYLTRYREESGKFTPPSTEIKAVKKVKNIAAYLTAYMASTRDSSSSKAKKEAESRFVEGRLWGISSYLVGLKGLRLSEEDGDFDTIMRFIHQNASSSFHKDFIHCYRYSGEVFEELIKVYCEFYGDQWLIDGGFDEEDISLLSVGAVCLAA